MSQVEDRFYQTIWREKIAREQDLAADGNLRVDAALPLLDRGQRLLDIGCGEGTLGSRASGLFAEVHGVDIADDAVRMATHKGIIARRINLNSEPLPYPDAYFDTVVTLDVIEHVFDPVRFVGEIVRVLQPGGSVILSTPNIRKIQRIATLVRGRFPRTSFDPVGYDGGHLHYFTARDVRVLFEASGLTVAHLGGIFGDRRTWKYRLAVALCGKNAEREFLANAILIKARKR